MPLLSQLADVVFILSTVWHQLSGQTSSCTATWLFEIHMIFPLMYCGLFYPYVQIPPCISALANWSHTAITHTYTTTQSIDTAADTRRVNCLDYHFFMQMHLKSAINFSIAVQQYSAASVFIVSEQALLPPDQNPLGAVGTLISFDLDMLHSLGEKWA